MQKKITVILILMQISCHLLIVVLSDRYSIVSVNWKNWMCANTWRNYMCLGTFKLCSHYNDIIMGTMASQITSLTIVYSTVYSGADQRKHQSSAPLAFVQGVHQWRMNSLPKWPVLRKMFPFDDIIMALSDLLPLHHSSSSSLRHRRD